jgi:hypothetical protein
VAQNVPAVTRTLRRLRGIARRGLLVGLALASIGSLALWVDTSFHYRTFDLMLEHRDASWSTTKEGTLFSYRGGVGLLLRRRFIPVTWEIDPNTLGWSAFLPSLHVGPSIDRNEYAIGRPIIDIGGLYFGRDRGPHPGFGANSLVVDHVIALPLWVVALLTGFWPARALVRRRRARRSATAAFEVVAPADAGPLSQAAARS